MPSRHPGRTAALAALLLAVAACNGTSAWGNGAPPPTPPAAPTPDTTDVGIVPTPDLLSPAEYLRLHNLATAPLDRGWQEAVVTLAAVGDGYTLVRLQGLDPRTLTSSQQALLETADTKLSERLAATSGPPSAAEIQARLERAAWADLTCDRCETTLVPWATKSLAAFADDPGVRATLERLRDSYEPAADLKLDSRWGLLSTRVRGYAAAILKGEAGQPAKTAP